MKLSYFDVNSCIAISDAIISHLNQASLSCLKLPYVYASLRRCGTAKRSAPRPCNFTSNWVQIVCFFVLLRKIITFSCSSYGLDGRYPLALSRSCGHVFMMFGAAVF